MRTRAIRTTTFGLALLVGWIIGASAQLCAGLGIWDQFVFPWDQWILVAPRWLTNWWVAVWVVLSTILPTVTVGMLMALGVGRLTRQRRLVPGADQPIRRGATDNHGHAAWASERQLLAQFPAPGCLIGAVSRGGVLIFDDVGKGPTHSLIFAGPGSDKTTGTITRLAHWTGPRVVFDPACELGPVMTPALTAAGFRVVNVSLGGAGIDVLDWIDIRNPESDAHIRSVVDWIYYEPSGLGGVRSRPDPFFGPNGKNLVTCLLAHLLHDPAADKTLAALRAGLVIPETLMQSVLTQIHAVSNSALARELAAGLVAMQSPRTFSGIYSSAFVATSWLSVAAYADVVSDDATMRTSDILDPKTVVFVQLPLRSLLATPGVGRAVMGALFNAMFHADTGAGQRILFQIDEAWLLGPMPEIKLCHTTARKYRGTVSSIWQSEGQLEEVWGRDGAKLMRDTCSWRSYNAVQDGDVAEKLSRDIGEHAVLATSEGDNTGRQKPWGIALPSQSRGRNTNVHEIKRRLVKGDEIIRAPADEMYVLARGFPHPIRCATAPYYRYPKLAARMAANRFTPAAS